MSAKKAESNGDRVAIPELIAHDPEKSEQYRAGWLFGKSKLPRAELKRWLETLGPAMNALPADFKNRTDIYVESPFTWGYFVACNEEQIHCQQKVGTCACVQIIDGVEQVGTLNGSLNQIPKFCFHDRDPSGRTKVVPAPLRALAVPDEVLEEVLEREERRSPAGMTEPLED